MKRRWFWLFGVFVVAVLGAGYFLIPFEEDRIGSFRLSFLERMKSRIEGRLPAWLR
jgi:hypothetical protein